MKAMKKALKAAAFVTAFALMGGLPLSMNISSFSAKSLTAYAADDDYTYG